jgi:predicted lysophospholipase L1 biosynthesis ABC-type transport system permease subunit
VLAFRLARIEFAAGIAGLRLFVACIAIGTLMLGAVWMLGAALSGAFDANGRQSIGGDAEISDVPSPLSPGIVDALSRHGSSRLSWTCVPRHGPGTVPRP